MSEKKKQQLGMNPSTASGRLLKDLIWRLVVESKHDKCYRCGLAMSRQTFSIEHKEAWLDSRDPVGLYFDMDNIDFSHRSCNSSAGAKTRPVHATEEDYKESKRAWDRNNRLYCPAKRREQYDRTGK